jgi:uncharacterized protein YgiM (DUF1202 family)
MFLCATRSPASIGQSCRHVGVLALAVAAVGAMCASRLQGQTASAPSTTVAPTLIIAPEAATAPAAVATAPARVVEAPVTATAPAVSILPPATGPAGIAATAPAAEAGTVTQPFVATVTGDKVYVRSGPDTKNYEIGQVAKGDLVYVVGLRQGWYQILPPNGAFCLVAKEFVELDNGGRSGTVKGEYVNVRAGSAIYKDSDYAILPPPLRKGAKLKVLGATEKYYQIAPPETAYFFVKADFVKAAPGAEYKVAQLKLPANVSGPTGVTVEAPTTLPTAVVISEPARITPSGTPLPTADGGTGRATTEPSLPVPVPRVTYSATALARYNEANAKYQEEARKAVAQQNLEGLLGDFNAILAMENISPSVKAGAQADITAIERTLTFQRLMKEQTAASEATKSQSEALRQQYEAAEKAIAAAREAGPYTAEGVLQTSTIVTGKYALVDPKSQRVVAYIDPSAASIDIGKLVGQYIGVRGISKHMQDSNAVVIQVSNATLMPQPK